MTYDLVTLFVLWHVAICSPLELGMFSLKSFSKIVTEGLSATSLNSINTYPFSYLFIYLFKFSFLFNSSVESYLTYFRIQSLKNIYLAKNSSNH